MKSSLRAEMYVNNDSITFKKLAEFICSITLTGVKGKEGYQVFSAVLWYCVTQKRTSAYYLTKAVQLLNMMVHNVTLSTNTCC